MASRRRLKEDFPELPLVMLTSKRQAEIEESETPGKRKILRRKTQEAETPIKILAGDSIVVIFDQSLHRPAERRGRPTW